MHRLRPLNMYPAWRRAIGAVGDMLRLTDPTDLVAHLFCEPHVAVRPCGDAIRTAVGGREGELGGSSRGRDPTDRVAAECREPEVAVLPGSDATGGHGATAGDATRELGDGSRGRDPTDPAAEFCEPEVAVRPGGDAKRFAGEAREGRDGELS